MLVLVPVFLSNLNTVSREWDVCDPAGTFGQECVSFSAAVANNPRLDSFSHPSERSEVWALGASKSLCGRILRRADSWSPVAGSHRGISWLADTSISSVITFSVSPVVHFRWAHTLQRAHTLQWAAHPLLLFSLGVPELPILLPLLPSTGILLLCLALFVCLVWFLVVVAASLFLASMYSLHGLRSSRDIPVRAYNMR